MRDFNKVSPRLWKSQKFHSLDDDRDAQIAYVYFLTNQHANSIGCYDLDLAYACADMRWPEPRLRKCIDTLSIAGLIAWDDVESTVLVVNWETFNAPTNAKHAIGLLKEIQQISSARLKVRIFKIIASEIEKRDFHNDKAVGSTIRRIFDEFRKPSDTLSILERRGEERRGEEIQNKNPVPPARATVPSRLEQDHMANAELEARLRQAAGWQELQEKRHRSLALTGPIEALIAAGADLEQDVLPIIAATAHRCGTPSWKYFVNAIQEAKQTREDIANGKAINSRAPRSNGARKSNVQLAGEELMREADERIERARAAADRKGQH